MSKSLQRHRAGRVQRGGVVVRILVSLLLIVLAIPVLLLFLALETTPALDRAVVLAPEHVARAKSILMGRYHANQRFGKVGTLFVRPDDADLAANYLVNRFARGSARVAVTDGSADVALSVPVPALPWLYVNVKATAVERDGLPGVTGLRVGDLPVPDVVSGALRSGVLAWLRRNPDYRIGIDAVERVRMLRWGVMAVYRWQPDLSRRMRAAAVDPAERERLRHYHDHLAGQLGHPPFGPVRMADLLPSLFALAAKRAESSSAVEENRSAILMAAIVSVGKSADILVPEARSWQPLHRRPVLLDGRDDFAKHFLVSAALAAYAGTVVADAVGLYKEVEDSRGGSGFSFNDIAADRAGTRFGEAASASEDSAVRLQERIAAGFVERDLIPETRDLPEFMPEAEFLQRFGGIGAPAYREMMDDIERRVADLRLYR
jgi:hypothetical protein